MTSFPVAVRTTTALQVAKVVSVPSQAHWPEERTQKFVELWANGVTASKIGAQLGVSRCAVLGKRHRMGLPHRAIDRHRIVAPRTIRERRRKPRVYVPRSEPVVPLEPSAEFRCDMLDLSRSQCRYPFGDSPFTFCGHPKQEQSSYCGFHHNVVWRPR